MNLLIQLNDRIDYLDRHGRFEEADIARRMRDSLFPIQEYDRSELVVNVSELETDAPLTG
jgi:hypothetical protein